MVKAELKELDRRISFDEMYGLFNGKIDPYFYENKIAPIGPAIMIGPDDRLGWTPESAKLQFLIAAQFFGMYQFPEKPAEVTPDATSEPKPKPKRKPAAKKKPVATKKKVKK